MHGILFSIVCARCMHLRYLNNIDSIEIFRHAKSKSGRKRLKFLYRLLRQRRGVKKAISYYVHI